MNALCYTLGTLCVLALMYATVLEEVEGRQVVCRDEHPCARRSKKVFCNKAHHPLGVCECLQPYCRHDRDCTGNASCIMKKSAKLEPFGPDAVHVCSGVCIDQTQPLAEK